MWENLRMMRKFEELSIGKEETSTLENGKTASCMAKAPILIETDAVMKADGKAVSKKDMEYSNGRMVTDMRDNFTKINAMVLVFRLMLTRGSIRVIGAKIRNMALGLCTGQMEKRHKVFGKIASYAEMLSSQTRKGNVSKKNGEVEIEKEARFS